MIQNSTSSKSNIFEMFPTYKLGISEVEKNAEQTNILRQKEVPQSESISSTPQKDIVEISTNEDKKSKKRKILFGSSIASTILTAGIAGLLIFRAPHTSSLKTRLPKFRSNLSKELHDASRQQLENIPSKISYYSKKAQSKIASGLEASLNVNMHKDRFVNKLFHITKATGKFADDCTAALRGVVDRTLGKKYKKVEGNLHDLTSILRKCDIEDLKALDAVKKAQKVTIKGETLTLGQWIERLEKQTVRLETSFDDAFSAGSVASRGKKRSGLLSKLSKKVDERFNIRKPKSYINPENYATYATDELSAEAREQLAREILKARKEVTNNITSISDHMRTSLGLFYDIVKPDDAKTRKTVNALRKNLEQFRTCSGSSEVQTRAEICKTMISSIDDIMNSLSSSSVYSVKEQKQMKRILQELKEDLLTSGGVGSKGALEEIKTILKGLNSADIEGLGSKVISDSRLKKFTRMSDKITKGMHSATELEMGEYFSKQAEMELGSAVSDVVSLMLPIGAAGVAIAKGDNKEERVSATLTTGIPLVGTFATAVYGTVKMFSGSKNLLFSLISGGVLSAIGNYADKLYKNYKSSGSVVNVVKDEYGKIWTGLESQMHQFDEPAMVKINAESLKEVQKDTSVLKEEQKK